MNDPNAVSPVEGIDVGLVSELRAAGEPIVWVTRSHLHLDRVATPWLILRFIDPHATFRFVEWGLSVAEGDTTIAFGTPGARLTPPSGSTSFAEVRRRFSIDSPALRRMERIVAAGVALAMGATIPDQLTDDEIALANSLNQLGRGYGIAFEDDDHLRHGLALYDAVHMLCSVAELDPKVAAQTPKPLPQRIAFLREAIDTASRPSTADTRN